VTGFFFRQYIFYEERCYLSLAWTPQCTSTLLAALNALLADGVDHHPAERVEHGSVRRHITDPYFDTRVSAASAQSPPQQPSFVHVRLDFGGHQGSWARCAVRRVEISVHISSRATAILFPVL